MTSMALGAGILFVGLVIGYGLGVLFMGAYLAGHRRTPETADVGRVQQQDDPAPDLEDGDDEFAEPVEADDLLVMVDGGRLMPFEEWMARNDHVTKH